MELLESRRLTGPNLNSDRPGAVMQVAVSESQRERVIEAWRASATALLDAVGWSNERTATRLFRGGADLFLSAPIDALYAACELNEWAWAAAVGEAEPARLDEAAEKLKGVIEAERNPRLLALRAAADERGVCFLSDEEFASVGMGEGSRVWPVDNLPSPSDVDWRAVHDVPTVLVTGTNGKSTTVRLLSAIVAAAGKTPGFCTTDWIRVGDETLDTGDWTGPGAARQVLRHPNTQVAVLEVARGGMLRRGLGVERADAAAVLNVSEDHLGEFGVDDMETLITTKFLVRRAVEPHGRLVLNADDAGVLARGRNAKTPVTWFGEDVPSDAAVACIPADGALTLVRDGERHPIAPIAEVPVTFGGAARFNVSNALAAIGLAAAIDIPLPAIAAGLRSFDSSPEANPGRSNVFELGGVTAIVDFAHNPHGVAALLEMAATMPATRRLVTLGQAGDRTDEAIADLVRATWNTKPDRIILKEMTSYLRGRRPGEVVKLMEQVLSAAGAPADRIGHAESEADAMEQALAWARDGDLLLFLIHAERAAVLERLNSLQDAGWRAGQSLA
ncbi:MAG: Mur ligase family protein [Planctomycetota bacterium]|jgi:UDP-N-acetylmuramyl tripeptide synthase